MDIADILLLSSIAPVDMLLRRNISLFHIKYLNFLLILSIWIYSTNSFDDDGSLPFNKA